MKNEKNFFEEVPLFMELWSL